MNFDVFKFGELFEFLQKSKFQASEGKNFGQYKFFTSSAIQKKWIDTATFDARALVFGTGGAASVHYVDDKFSTSTDCIVANVRENSAVSLKYVWHYLMANIDILERGFKGAGLKHISKKYIEDIKIPIPNIAEQKRIALILDKASEIKAKREQAIAKLNDLINNTFTQFFEINKRYEYRKLSDVCELITDGTHYTPSYADDGVIFLSAKNVTSGRIDWENIKHIPNSLHLELQKRVSPRRGDVLLAKNGTTGVAAIVDKDIIFDIYVSLALLRPGSNLLPGFLHAALNSTITKRQFNKALKGIGVPNLHLIDIRKTTIPFPTIGEQKEFINVIRSINACRDLNLNYLHENTNLINSLQSQLFDKRLN